MRGAQPVALGFERRLFAARDALGDRLRGIRQLRGYRQRADVVQEACGERDLSGRLVSQQALSDSGGQSAQRCARSISSASRGEISRNSE